MDVVNYATLIIAYNIYIIYINLKLPFVRAKLFTFIGVALITNSPFSYIVVYRLVLLNI